MTVNEGHFRLYCVFLYKIFLLTCLLYYVLNGTSGTDTVKLSYNDLS